MAEKIPATTAIAGLMSAAEYLIPSMETVFPVSRHEDQDKIEGAKDKVMLYGGIAFCTLLVLRAMFSSPMVPSDTLAYFFIAFLVFVTVALYLGGFSRVTVWGSGFLKDEIGTFNLRRKDAENITTYYQDKRVPDYQYFLYPMKDGKRKKQWYTIIQEDLAAGRWIECRLERDLFVILESNIGYLALFMFAAVPLFFLLAFTEAGLFGWVRPAFWCFVVLAAIEEMAKGCLYFVTATKDTRLWVWRKALPREFSKGVVAGCGYAFVETYSRLFGTVDPMMNLIVRIPTTLPLHAITSGIFFVGMSQVFHDHRSERSFQEEFQDLQKIISREILTLPYVKGLGCILLAVVIHALYFTVAFDMRGVF